MVLALVELPPVLAMALAFIVIPLLYHHLLRSNLPNWAIVIIAFIINQATLLTPCTDNVITKLIKGCLNNNVLLRYLEAATLPRFVSRKWTLYETLEFWVTSENRHVREFHASYKDKSTVKAYNLLNRVRTIERKDRGLKFWFGFFVNVLVVVVMYAFAKAWFIVHPYEHFAWLLDLRDWDAVVQHIMVAVLMYYNLELSFIVLKVPFVLLLGLPYGGIFNSPLFATSLRDMWSNRWNTRMQGTMHTLGFKPTFDMLQSRSKDKSAETRTRHLQIATLAGFAVSSIFHEYMVLLWEPGHSLGGSTVFFMLHGCLVLLQVALQRATGYGITWGKGLVFKLLGWASTMLVFLITAPMFCPPFTGEMTRSHYSPPFLNDFFVGIIAQQASK